MIKKIAFLDKNYLPCVTKNCLDADNAAIRRPQELRKYLVRVHLRVNGTDFAKHSKQVHVRPFALLLLLDFLIDQEHESFMEKDRR